MSKNMLVLCILTLFKFNLLSVHLNIYIMFTFYFSRHDIQTCGFQWACVCVCVCVCGGGVGGCSGIYYCASISLRNIRLLFSRMAMTKRWMDATGQQIDQTPRRRDVAWTSSSIDAGVVSVIDLF